ncbi:MAG: CRISPR-associated endonuclease Cas1 [Ignavibacteria bacterium]|nr:CRISPR-associated endonuclease Cas1 [Ignavibacteria bacterium]
MSLYEKIISKNSLINGFFRVKENDGCSGFDNQSIEQFEDELENNINSLNIELKQKRYSPQPVIFFEKKKENGSHRLLSVFAVRDRIVQSAAYIILNPIFDKEFESSSFGFRKGISREDAVRKICSYYNSGYRWILDADIKLFFDTVDHKVILHKLQNLISDKNVISLLKIFIEPSCIVKNKKKQIKRGLVQGSVISPLLANLYLDEFDEKINEKGLKLVRYADDFLILAKDKPEAEEALELSKQFLNELNLELNLEKTSIVNFEQGFKYLGYVFLNSIVVPGSSKDTSSPIPRGSKQKLSPDTVLTIEKITSKVKSAEVEKTSSSETLKSTVLGSAFLDALMEKGVSVEEFLNSMDKSTLEKEDILEAEIKEKFTGEEDMESVDEDTSGFEIPEHLISLNRTLYVQENGCFIKKEGNRLIIEKEDVEILDIPLMKISSIILFGNSIITPAVMQHALKNRIAITLLSGTGKYYGTIESTFSNNIDVERIQLLRSFDKSFTLNFAKTIVKTKINNQRIILMRYARGKNDKTLELRIAYMKKVLSRVEQVQDIEDVRGLEGVSAAAYFNVFGTLFKVDTGFFTKRFRRTKHPPLDQVNSLLSFGYTMLLSNIYSFIKVNNLNPYCGLFHAVKSGHPALASDLIEEFRFVIDSLVLNLINHKILTYKDFFFEKEIGTPCYLTPKARKIFIKHFEFKMHQRVLHKQTGFKVDYRRCLNLQVQQFAQFIKGNSSDYFPTKLET